MKLFKNQRGSIDMILIAIVLIGAIAVAGYTVYRQRQTRAELHDPGNGAGAQMQVNTTPADPYAGWKTYTNDYENDSLKYPANWSVVAKPSTYQYPEEKKGMTHDLVLTAPSGFKLFYRSGIDGLGGACEDNCPTHHIYSLEPLASSSDYYLVGVGHSSPGVPEVKELSIIGRSLIDYDKKVAVGYEYKAFWYQVFPSHSVEKFGSLFSTSESFGGNTTNAKYQDQSATNYFKEGDLQTAKLILASLTFSK